MKLKEELKDLKAKSATELAKLLAASREKMRDLNFKIAQNQNKDVRETRVVRKNIARILTVLNQLNKKQ